MVYDVVCAVVRCLVCTVLSYNVCTGVSCVVCAAATRTPQETACPPIAV